MFRAVHNLAGPPARRAARAAALSTTGSDGWPLVRDVLRNYTVVKCGEFVGFYNNFFITKVSFWRSAPVKRFLESVDQSGFIYTRRWNDILWQTSAVQISYLQAMEMIIAADGWTGLLCRGLGTRLLANALQSALFAVIWKMIEAHINGA